MLVALAIAFSPVSRAGSSFYAIGNSLTNDLYPIQLPLMASQRGRDLTVGYHIRGGLSLDYIVANPQDVTISLGGTLDSALVRGTWNQVSVQPYFGTNSTLASDVASIEQIVTLMRSGPSRDATIYLYAAWPSQSASQNDYQTFWNAAVPDLASQPTIARRQYFDLLLARLRARYGTTVNFHVIPAGDVLARIDREIRLGKMPGVNALGELYRDDIHMGQVGRYVAAATVHATLLRDDPRGLTVPQGYYLEDGVARLSPALIARIHELVWEVVSTDPRTGVAVTAPADPGVVTPSTSSTTPTTPTTPATTSAPTTTTPSSTPATSTPSTTPTSPTTPSAPTTSAPTTTTTTTSTTTGASTPPTPTTTSTTSTTTTTASTPATTPTTPPPSSTTTTSSASTTPPTATPATTTTGQVQDGSGSSGGGGSLPLATLFALAIAAFGRRVRLA